MKRNLTPEEARDQHIADLTEQRLAAWREKLLAKDPRAESDLQNVILDRLSADDAKALFVKAATSGSTIHFEQLVARYMADQCEIEAIKEVEQLEKQRADEITDNRIDQHQFARWAAHA